MALVAYGSDISDSEEDEQEEECLKAAASRQEGLINASVSEESTSSADFISDDEEHRAELNEGCANPASSSSTEGIASVVDDEGDVIGVSSCSKSFFSSLPASALRRTEERLSAPATAATPTPATDFVDADEDLSTIPKAKQYEAPQRQKPITTQPTLQLAALRRKGRGPIQILAPSLDALDDNDEDESERKRLRPTAGSRKASGLAALLPAPRNTSVKVANRTLIPDAVAGNRKPSRPPPKATIRPAAALTSSAAARVNQRPAHDSDSDEDAPFFTLSSDNSSLPSAGSIFTTALPSVIANPDAYGPVDRSLVSSRASYASKASPSVHDEPHPSLRYRPSTSALLPDSGETSGPATGVYPPPPPPPDQRYSTLPDAGDLMANAAAIEKLAGKHAMRKEEFDNIVDVNGDDIAPDAKEWMVKSLSKEAEVGPRCKIKGQTKRKHQITYLAAVAKENEFKLREEWAVAAQNRRAASNKYGF